MAMLIQRQESGAPAGPPPGELLAAAERVVGSRTFSRSPRLRAFLTFVARCAAENRVQEINEYSIGVQVFGKPPGFAPQEDNIVRVTARQLRVKLDEYYRDEGRAETWRIEVPKGSYVPELRPNAAPALARPRLRLTAAWLWAGLAVAGWAAAWMGWNRPVPPREPLYLLEPLFDNRRLPVLWVLEDPLLPLSWRHAKTFPSLNDFLAGLHRNPLTYPEAERESIYPLVAQNKLFRASNLELLERLERAALARGAELRLASWRDAVPSQFAAGNVILTGGIGGNPWVSAFQKETAFEHRVDPPSNRRSFVNRRPKPGEPPEFATSDQAQPPHYYARLALLRNPYGAGWVALAGGTSRDSTEGAWRYALSQRGMAEVRARCRNPERGFEVILETVALGSTPMQWSLKALRCAGE